MGWHRCGHNLSVRGPWLQIRLLTLRWPACLKRGTSRKWSWAAFCAFSRKARLVPPLRSLIARRALLFRPWGSLTSCSAWIQISKELNLRCGGLPNDLVLAQGLRILRTSQKGHRTRVWKGRLDWPKRTVSYTSSNSIFASRTRWLFAHGMVAKPLWIHFLLSKLVTYLSLQIGRLMYQRQKISLFFERSFLSPCGQVLSQSWKRGRESWLSRKGS